MRTHGPVPLVCRDKCLAVGRCSGHFGVCHLTFPGSRIGCNFVGFVLPFCAPVPSKRQHFCVNGFVGRLRTNSMTTFLAHLRSFFTSFPCRLGRGGRHRCRIIFCLIFGLVKRFARTRMHDTHKETSTIMGAPSRVCIFRFGLGNATRRTLRRVSSENCLVPCLISKHRVIGIKMRFDTRAQGVDH